MGSEYVDGGPSLGSALGGVFGKFNAAPGQALDNMALADKIAWDRRTKKANIALSESADAAIPQASVPPRFFNAADIANPAILDAPPLSALKPAGAGKKTEATITPGFNPDSIDPQELPQAQAQRAFAFRGVQATTLSARKCGRRSSASRG